MNKDIYIKKPADAIKEIFGGSKDYEIADFLKIAKTGGPLVARLLLGQQSDFDLHELAEDIVKVKKKVDFLHTNYGIDYFDRFSKEMLENAYLTATDPTFSKHKKVAIIILNKDDWNGAFEQNTSQYESLIDNGYCLVFCEAKDETELAERFFNYGLKEGAKSILSGKKKYDLLVLGGHGTSEGIGLGGRLDQLDLDDFKKPFLKHESWNNMFVSGASIVLLSCSTGGDINDIYIQTTDNKSGNFSNILQMISILASNTNVFAPETDASLESFVFEDGNCVSADFLESKTKVYKNGKIVK